MNDAGNTPVTAKHNFGFPSTTTISICNLFANDEPRQPFRELLNSSGLRWKASTGIISAWVVRAI